jgi:hypothetical protein
MGWAVFVLARLLLTPQAARPLAIEIGLIVLIVPLLAIASFRIRATVSGDELMLRSLLRTRHFQTSTVYRALQVTVLNLLVSSDSRYVLLLDSRSRCLARFETSWWWNPNDVEALIDAIGTKVESGGLLRPKDARRLYPGSVPWWIARPWLSSCLIVGLVMVGIAIIVALVRG